jgi:hypothetical protein
MSLHPNSESDAKTLSDLLSAEPLKRLIRGANDQEILKQLITDVTPKNLFDNITSWQITHQQIVLTVTSASWATRLRAHRNDLLFGAERYFRSLGRLTDLKILVRPLQQKKPVQKKRKQIPPKTPTKAAIELVQVAALSCDNDALKSALNHLADHMQLYSRDSR